MAWKKDGTPDTLTSAGLNLDIPDLNGLKFMVLLWHTINSGTSYPRELTFDGNVNTDYAERLSRNGGTDTTAINQIDIITDAGGAGTGDQFSIGYWSNLAGEEKLGMFWTMVANTTGAGSAPDRSEHIGKMDTTTDSAAFTQVELEENGGGNYQIDSNLSALGTD